MFLNNKYLVSNSSSNETKLISGLDLSLQQLVLIQKEEVERGEAKVASEVQKQWFLLNSIPCHKSLLKTCELVVEEKTHSLVFQEPGKISLKDFVFQFGTVDEFTLCFIVWKLCSVLEHLEKYNLSCSKLRPETIVLSSNFEPVLLNSLVELEEQQTKRELQQQEKQRELVDLINFLFKGEKEEKEEKEEEKEKEEKQKVVSFVSQLKEQNFSFEQVLNNGWFKRREQELRDFELPDQVKLRDLRNYFVDKGVVGEQEREQQLERQQLERGQRTFTQRLGDEMKRVLNKRQREVKVPKLLQKEARMKSVFVFQQR